MPESESRPLNIICIATYFKGGDFIRECKRLGCHVVLITKEKMLKEDWPRASLDDLVAVPNDADVPLFIDLVAFLSRKNNVDRVIALEEFDVVTAALIREHLGLPGMSSSTAKGFRDKLTMGLNARKAGLDVPEFVPLINPDEIRDFMERVPPPWIIKPRSDVSAIGIRKVSKSDEVWRAADELNERKILRERSSYHLLAQFIPGEVFHIDSLVNNGRVAFAGANKYGRPPMQVAHQGGAYISHTIPRASKDEKKLFAINRKLVKALGLARGATHAEFIKSQADGRFYFLEIAARVGGAYIAEVLEAATGVNLWREWARSEVSDDVPAQKPDREEGLAKEKVEKPGREGERLIHRIKPLRREYAGIILSLAKQEHPDTSAYDDPEIVYRVKKKHHAGLIVRSKKLERVQQLLNQYAEHFAEDFEAVLPPLERAE